MSGTASAKDVLRSEIQIQEHLHLLRLAFEQRNAEGRAMAQPLQFLPLQTSISPSFWQRLTELKLHRLQLSDAPVPIIGHYGRGKQVTDRVTGQTVAINAGLELDAASFDCAPTTPQPHERGADDVGQERGGEEDEERSVTRTATVVIARLDTLSYAARSPSPVARQSAPAYAGPCATSTRSKNFAIATRHGCWTSSENRRVRSALIDAILPADGYQARVRRSGLARRRVPQRRRIRRGRRSKRSTRSS